MTKRRIKLPVEAGSVGAILQSAADQTHVIVLAHGAGANMEHAHMAAIADALAAVGIGSLRFNFPYMEAGKPRTDKPEICVSVFDAALDRLLNTGCTDPILIGGHSFGGRMATHAAAELSRGDIVGVVCFSFPLHMPKKPTTKRAAHLPAISVPMLLLSGDRDGMIERDLIEPIVEDLPLATLHWLHTADHSYKILKRTRTGPESVYDEAARVLRGWSERTLAKPG
jgi:predicted alpha/beta-hydrolase family hydrolase